MSANPLAFRDGLVASMQSDKEANLFFRNGLVLLLLAILASAWAFAKAGANLSMLSLV
jgi:hypothetical protein